MGFRPIMNTGLYTILTIRSRSEELISKLRLDCEDVLVVGVFGFGGMGKTAIVKDMRNKIASKFEASCFLEDIHCCCDGKGDWKFELQADLISQLNKDDKVKLSFDRVVKIQNLVRRKKTLLVLDDVQNFEQLEVLGINPVLFHKGSRIIVTTRNQESLGGIPHTSYHTRLLNKRESRKLFIQHMFARDEPVHTEFVEEVVARAGGLPLVLKVWSRHFTQYKEHLPAALETLKQIPHDDVQKKLQMSYNPLSPEAKNLFLDIACFFNRLIIAEKGLVFKVLNDEGFSLDYEIEKLAHKFLVENEGYFVWLPQLIKEMGHEVVRQENPEEPGKRTRLMKYGDVVRVLRECSGTDSVRSIRLDYNFSFKMGEEREEEATVQLEAFKKMTSLRFIQLANPNLQWSFSSNDDMSCYTFKHLKYLEWYKFPCKSLDNIDMGNVVVIKLQGSKLEKLWEGANKSLKKLKILDVKGSRFLTKTGNFIGLDNLEELSLSECSNLEELDSSIGCLQKLVILNLNFCTRLKSLSWEMISKLTSLQYLSLHNCTNLLEVSDAAGSPISLKHLDLTRTMIISLPNSLCQLHQLTFLELNKCTNLKSIPDLPPIIEKLRVFDCINLSSLPNSICQLHQLTYIDFRGCTNLKSIPDLPPGIETLYVFDCINLVDLPSNCSELQFLTELILCDCSKLGDEGFTQVTGLRNLQSLEMENCNVSQVSSGIGNLVSLRYLNLSGNTFSSLPETFSNLSKLEQLRINDCSKLQLLPPLPSHLEEIEASNCGLLDVMPFDSMQKAYIFRSELFDESQLMNDEGLLITLSGKELPQCCTYRNSGNVLSFVAPIQIDHNKICGLILCATRDKYDEYKDDEYEDDEYEEWIVPKIYNKTKGTSYLFCDQYLREHENYEEWVMFYPLDDTTLVVEAGDTVKVELDGRYKSCGLRLIYEDDVVDTGLVLKDVREPLIPTTEMFAGIIQLSGDDDVHVNDDGLIIQDVTNPTLPVFPSSESEIMSGIITQLNDMEVRSSIQDVEYPYYDYLNVVPEFQMCWEGNW